MANNTSEVIKNNSCSSNINQDIKQYLLTQKVDEVTESEMKKIEVQKMEDDMTIKMLELEYSEKKRNFIYTTRKLQELQKKISIQTEMIDKLLHVNKAIVEKFHELKRFQNDIILININNAEKTFLTCKNENVKLSKTFQIIIEKENYNESLNKHILDKKYHLNKDIQRQIEQKKKENDNRNKVLSQRTLNIENLKIRLNKEKVGNNLKSLVEEKNKRIIQLEADGEVLQKQIKQEMESLIQDKNNQIHELDNNSYKLLEEKNILISKLQTDLLRMENDIIERRTTLTKVEMEREQIRKEVSKKREINELSESALNESVRNINNEQNKINIELENAKITFLKNETNWHAEMNTLFSKVEERKKLFEKLNGYQKELTKLKEASREASLQKQKEIISDKEFQPTIKKLNEQFKKYEQTISTTIKKQHEFNIKIKELLEKRSAVKQKLDSSDLNEVDTNKNLNSFHDCTTKNPYSYIQDIQSTSLQSKAIELTEDIEKLKSSQEKLSNQLSLEKAKPPSTPTKKSIYSFSIDDSDESDDEFKVQNLTPNKYSGLSTTPKKSVYNVEKEDEINKNELLNTII